MSLNKERRTPISPNRFAFGGGTKPLSELMFNKYDLDKNGSISRNELRSLCYDMGYYLSDDELSWAWTIIDKDGSDHIDYREFSDWWKMSSRFDHLKLLNDQEKILIYQIAEIFRSYDVSNQGTLNRTQFTRFYQDLIRENIIDTNAHQASQFNEIDRGQDGQIHFNELIAWLRDISVLGNTAISNS